MNEGHSGARACEPEGVLLTFPPRHLLPRQPPFHWRAASAMAERTMSLCPCLPTKLLP